jgi:hypothetical protein
LGRYGVLFLFPENWNQLKAINESSLRNEKKQHRATESNTKQQKATIDSNTEQHHNTFVKRQGTMSHPVAPDVPNA